MITYIQKASPNSELVELTSNLSAVQLKALPLIVSGMMQYKVAHKLGITRQTLNVWQNEPDFQRALNDLKQQAYLSTQLKLSSLSTTAVNTLSDLINHSPHDAVRLKASMYVLDLLKITEQLQPDNQDDNVDITAILTALGESNV